MDYKELDTTDRLSLLHTAEVGGGLLFYFLFLSQLLSMWDLSSLTRDQTCDPFLHWKCRVLSTGPPGKFLLFCLFWGLLAKSLDQATVN